MNKKLVLSVLSTAVLTSMAASAMAKPSQGFYVGGEVDKYYSPTALLADFKAGLKEILSNAIDTVYVNKDGKAANFLVAAEAEKMEDVLKPATRDLFEENDYAVVGSEGEKWNPADEDDWPVPGDITVESVSAINKTKVDVKFNKAVDSIKAENFAIEGATVTSATLSEDKKSVSLVVSGLNYKSSYTLVVKDVLVDGKEIEDMSKTFTTPAVTDLWNLQVSPKAGAIKADGADNTVITFNLIDKTTGKVDTNADDVVLDLNTTQGNLAKKRAVIQDGTATVVLTSEFSVKELTAKIDAQIIEASGDYKDLIGQVVGTATVKFVTDDVGTVEAINLVSAESNQADRVTLFFDKNVTLATVVKTNTKGELLYSVKGAGEYTKADIPKGTKAADIAHVLRTNAIKVKQAGNEVPVQGVKPVAGNSKALEVILAKNVDTDGKFNPKKPILIDNAQVDVEVITTNSIEKETESSATFKLTDARDPEATSVTPEGLNTLKVKFSEAINQATFQIDGRFGSDTFTTTYGDFNPATLEDNRDLVTIKLNQNYDEDGDGKDALPGFFTAGKHSLQISSIEDFAAVTDKNNVGSTQTLGFEIVADPSAPTAEVKVESPEQIRVTFNKTLSKELKDSDFELQYYDADAKEYTAVAKAKDGVFEEEPVLTVDPISSTEYVLELTQDWTKIFGTKKNNVNYYNHKFRIFIKEGTVANAANGVENKDITLDLNYSGSPLNTPDTKSPTIKSIEKVGKDPETGKDLFVVTVDEPVKLSNADGSEKPTLNEDQTYLPETSVQFYGKDKDGVTKTVDGVVGTYADDNGADTQFYVTADLQKLVDEQDYSENWELAVKSLSDDVGNTVNTKTTAFKVTKSPAPDTPFYIERAEGMLNGTEKDTVTITFSEGVQYKGGEFDATNPSQYTLNGKLTPVGTSISVKDLDGNTKNGFETVVITLPDGTLLNAGNNIITVNKNLESFDNTKLTRAYEVAINVLDTVGNVLAAATKSVEALETAAKADLTVEANLKAAEAAVTAAETAVAKVAEGPEKKALQDKVDTAKKAVADARDAFEAAKAQVLEDAKAAVAALETAAGKDLTAKADLEAAEKAVTDAEAAVAKVAEGADKTELEEKVAASKTKVEAARKAFDDKAAGDLVKAAEDAVDKLVAAASQDLTVEQNLKDAEAAVKTAEEAVGQLADGATKTYLSGKVATNKTKVEEARKAFDEKAGEALVKAAEDAVDSLVIAASKNLTEEQSLKDAEAAVKAAEEAVAKLAAGEKKTYLEGKVTTNKEKVEKARQAFDAKALDDAKGAVAALFADDTKAALAAGVDQDAIDTAKAKVDALDDAVAEKAGLLDDVQAAQDLLDAANAAAKLQDAQTAVAALFEDDTKAALAADVDQDAIDAAQAKVNALDDSVAEKAALQDDIDQAQDLLDAANAAAILKEAQDAVAALFEDDTKAALAADVDQDAIDAAQAKVNALDDSVAEKAALLDDIDAAQALLTP